MTATGGRSKGRGPGHRAAAGRSGTRGHRLLAGGLAVAATTSGLIGLTGLAQAGTPPTGPGNIEIFNKRSMVALEGYTAQAGETATVEVIRDGATIAIGQGTIDETGFLEFNHPGGECWIGVTPNLYGGDEVKVSFSESPFTDSAITMSPAVTSVVGSGFTPSGAPLEEGDHPDRVYGTGTVTMTGTYDPADPWFDPARFVIETVNPDNRDDKTPDGEDPGLVDDRAMGITLVPDAEHPNGATDPVTGEPLWEASATLDAATGTWAGVYTLYTEVDYDRTLAGDHVAASWMAESGELALGLTQNEYEEIPGPQMGGCPPSPSGVAPNPPSTASLSSATGGTSVDVAWQTPAQPADAPEVTGYRVAAIGGTHAEQETAERTGATSVSLDGLEAGATYEIMIEAYNGQWSAPQSVGTVVVGSGTGTGGTEEPPPPDTSTEAPAAPTGLAATANDAGGADVSWTAAEGAASYEVSATTTAPGAATPVTTTVQAPATTATLSGLTAGTTYSVMVTAVNAAGSTPAAEPVPVTTGDVVAPGAFTLTRVLPGHQSITAEWTAAEPGNAASPVTGYDLVATPATGDAVTATVTGLTGTVTGLQNGVEYTVTVAARSGEAATDGTLGTDVDNTVTPNDVVTVGRAQFRDDRNEYRISGTAQATTGNGITVRLSTGELVASDVAVGADGAWSVRTRNGPQAALGTTLTVTSLQGADLTGVPLQRR